MEQIHVEQQKENEEAVVECLQGMEDPACAAFDTLCHYLVPDFSVPTGLEDNVSCDPASPEDGPVTTFTFSRLARKVRLMSDLLHSKLLEQQEIRPKEDLLSDSIFAAQQEVGLALNRLSWAIFNLQNPTSPNAVGLHRGWIITDRTAVRQKPDPMQLLAQFFSQGGFLE